MAKGINWPQVVRLLYEKAGRLPADVASLTHDQLWALTDDVENLIPPAGSGGGNIVTGTPEELAARFPWFEEMQRNAAKLEKQSKRKRRKERRAQMKQYLQDQDSKT